MMTITSMALLDYLSYHEDNNVTKLIFEYLFGDYYGPAFGNSFKYYNFYHKYLYERWRSVFDDSLKYHSFYQKYLSERWRYIPLLFTMVKNTSMQMYLEAVSHNGMLLQYITYQTEEICSKAVQETGRALQYVQNQTEKICLKAVQQNSNTLELVLNQTEKIRLKAMKLNQSVAIELNIKTID